MALTIEQVFFRVQDRGGEAFAAYLDQAFEERRHKVECLGFGSGDGELGKVTDQWTLLHDGPPTVSSIVRSVVALLKRWRQSSPDAVITHTQVAGLLAMPIAAVCGVKRRICVHHQPHGRDLGWPFYVADALWGTLGVYTHVVLVSDLALEQIRRFPRRYRRRTVLLRNEVPMRPLPSRGESQAHLDLSDDTLNLCFIGSISHRKGALTAALAAQARSDCTLLVVGKPSTATAEVRAIADESGGRIRLLGMLTPAEIPAVLSATDALVFPSKAENRSLAVLEAEAAGLAIIASDIRANRDVLGTAGHFCDPEDQDSWNQAVMQLDAVAIRQSRKTLGPERFEKMIDAYEALVTPRISADASRQE